MIIIIIINSYFSNTKNFGSNGNKKKKHPKNITQTYNFRKTKSVHFYHKTFSPMKDEM